ncbi:mannitol dehydrogenase family protein [Aquipuribacter sp. SD81]|uniref:mannitol dehydrogenase family protein n=1 Tax=Aquipuribacter sp. SD81 TaxID=3127703 RepID=UPI0030171C22
MTGTTEAEVGTPDGAAVTRLPDVPPGVPAPPYDRSRVTAGIVHLGVGGFHRAHQAVYLDDLLARGGDALGWGVCGVGILPADAAMRDALRAQDCLYTVVVKHADDRLEPRVVGSLVEYLLLPDDPHAVVERMADPAVRIVSLTVTEGGYHVHQVTGELDASDPALQADLVPGAAPTTTFGLLLAALRLRRERGVPPFTVLSCDNLQGNGDIARRMVAAYARLADPALGEWVASEVAFPNCMVDRITPVTRDGDREALAATAGLADRWPVVCEPFTQWVVEERFPLGRPAWEEVGVQMADSVEPYELIKLRLLNASHQAIAYLGHLAGHTYAHEVLDRDDFRRLLRGYMDLEATPTLHEVPGMDLEEYKATLLERFANPQIADTLARLCAFSSDRIPKWLLPVVRERLAAGGSVDHAALVVAAWARYAEGVDEQGRPIEVVDRLRGRVMAAAARHEEDELAFLRDPDLFGGLVDEPAFTEPYLRSLRTLRSTGADAALREVVG